MSQKNKFPFVLSLLIGLFLVAISIYGFILLRSRPDLPEDIKIQELVQIDDIQIRSAKDLEFILIQKSIGDWATFRVRRNGTIESRRAQFIAHYSTVPFPLIYLLIGLFCYLIGIVVYFLKRDDRKARILYWLGLVFGYLLIVSGGTYCLRKEWLSYLPVVPFYVLYPLAPALLSHFALAFSAARQRTTILIIYTLSLGFSAFFLVTILISTLTSSISVFRLYIFAFPIFRLYMSILLLAAIFYFVFLYRRSTFEEKKAQIKWIFLGLLFGLGPFILVYQIPLVLKLRPLLSEEFSSVFFVFAPLGLAFSILRFRFLDVEVVINRSLVYSLLTIFTVSVYLLAVRIFQDLLSRLFTVHEAMVFLGSAVLAALVFHPARRRIQEFVDRSFFRQSYDYKKAILRFNEMASGVLTQEDLLDHFVVGIKRTIPVEAMTVAIYTVTAGVCRSLWRRGPIESDEWPDPLDLPVEGIWARRGAVSTEEGVDFSRGDTLAHRALEILFPLPFHSTSLRGLLALGKKKSGQRFSRDDIDLLLTMAGELALNIERVQLQEEVVYEKASREKLDELNRLKTEFISTVSHELRTPLSSIQGLTEILLEGKLRDKGRREEALAVLASESGRLSRLVHNILDFGKIEQQTKTYVFKKVEMRELIEEVSAIFHHQLDAQGFSFGLNLPSHPVSLDIDRDAVKQVLINLIDNAIKYSSETKDIEINLRETPAEVEIQVGDRGIGIPPEVKEKIFDKFFRAPEAAKINPKGVGLGLKIVRHIMEAHRGEVRAENRLPHGSLFRLIFPKVER